MTLDDFKERYSGAPYPLEEFAEIAREIEGEDNGLRWYAREFLDKKRLFEFELKQHGVEVG